MAHVDSGMRINKGGLDSTSEPIGGIGRKQKEVDRHRNTKPRSNGFLEEGVDTIRQDEQHIGDGVPESAQCLKC